MLSLFFDPLLPLRRQTPERHSTVFSLAVLIIHQLHYLRLLISLLPLFKPAYKAFIVQERQEHRLIVVIIVVVI